MGKSKELSFEPSRGLSVITGLLEGLTERKKNMEEAEASAAKNQMALMRQLLPTLFRERGEQRRFDVREKRETKEFEQKQELAKETFDFQKANAQFNRDFDLKLQDMKNTFASLSREDEQTFDLKMSELKQAFNLRLQEMNQNFDLRLQQSTQTFQDRQRQKGESFRAGEAGAGRTFTTAEREASQTFREIENNLDRELQRDLRGKVFSDEEQVVVSNYEAATKKYEGFISILANPEHSKNAIINEEAVKAADEMARWGNQLAPIYEAKGLAPPLIPPKIQPFVQKRFARDTQFGFLPRLEVPTDVETIDEPIEAVETEASKKVSAVEKTPKKTVPSDKVSAAIDAAKRNKRTTLTDEIIAGLKNRGYTDEEIEQIKAGL